MKKEILRQLKSDYEELEIKPSLDLWDQLDHQLNDGNIVEEKRPKNSIRQFLKIAAVLLLLLTTGFLLKSVFEKSNPKTIAVKRINNIDNSVVTDITVIPTVNEKEFIGLKSEKNEIAETAFSNKQQTIKSADIKSTSVSELIPVEKETVAIHNFIADERPPVLATSTENKQKYVSADDLLFQYELDKTKIEKQDDHARLGQIKTWELEKVHGPKSLKILGISIISENP